MSTKILDSAPSTVTVLNSPVQYIEGIQLGKPGGKRSITLKLLKPNELNTSWQPCLLTIQNYLLSQMPILSMDGWMRMSGNEEKFAQVVKVVSALLLWQQLYKELEEPKFKIRCNQRSLIESLKPAMFPFASTFKLCRQVFPDQYADHYRDYLHWFACCWHEDFTQSRSLASAHHGKRSDVLKMRSLSAQYKDNYNPHDPTKEIHHYRLIDTATKQKKDSESWKVFREYRLQCVAFTKVLEQQPHVWTFGRDGFQILKGRGRPRL